MVANAWRTAGFSCLRYDSVNFTDVDYSTEAGEAIQCLQLLGVLPLDYTATTFKPEALIARGDAAVLLARLWREDPHVPPPLPDPPPPTELNEPDPDGPSGPNNPTATVPATPAAPNLTPGNTTINAS